ncbi:endosome-associated-trafficking regulator 1-like [Branchiostoma lanceolatum]|uniref:endosome-associated-trafficking regulator 1-like n=1 Tax=Branchiostoma lanceolatum TaxID=7740 RepID=UPI003453EF43
MAEGSSGEGDPPSEEENPFSFRKFVGKPGSKGQEQNSTKAEKPAVQEKEDLLDIFAGPAEVKPREQLKVQMEEEDAPPSKGKAKSKKDKNPFSFKEFLRESATKSTKTKSSPQKKSPPEHLLPPVSLPKSSTFQQHKGDELPPVTSTELPDFVQDYFLTDTKTAIPEKHLPSFFSDPEVPGIVDGTTGQNAQPLDNVLGAGLASVEIPTVNPEAGSVESSVQEGPINLPDFLSDGAMCNGELEEEGQESAGAAAGVDHTVFVQMEKDNRTLRRQLVEARRQVQSQTERISELQQQMSAQSKAEAEETAALERMVQQVETNLEVATKRAVTAEETIAKQKKEIKSLQARVSLLTQENSSLRAGDSPLTGVREKAKSASEQLSTAAKNADQSIRQLLTGVETLKLVSDLLADIDKITEVKEEPPPPDSQGATS